MAISLTVAPGPALRREEFLLTHPPFSIALDGYVAGPPFLALTQSGPYRNFNHHEAVDRSCTCATCEQARRAVLLGLFDLFSAADGRRASLFVNDCDQDVCLATFTLMNPERATEPLLRQLSQIEDLLDISAGGFPMPHESEILCKVRWVFEPYSRARNRVTGMPAEDMRAIIGFVHQRIEAFLEGRAGELALEGSFTPRGGGADWTLAEVDGPHAREKMIAAGIRAAVEITGRVGDRFVYSLWRRSEYIVRFPVRDLLRALNAAEGLPADDRAGWGGSENAGGSPRGKGSRLPPPEVAAVVEGELGRAFPPAVANRR
jgi:hypothetical protein